MKAPLSGHLTSAELCPAVGSVCSRHNLIEKREGCCNSVRLEENLLQLVSAFCPVKGVFVNKLCLDHWRKTLNLRSFLIV